MEISRPIFLVGFPRSGTTFLQSLIATQKGIVSFPETHFYTVLTGYMDSSLQIQQEAIPEILNRAERMMELNLSPQDHAGLLESITDKGIPRRDLYEWILGRLCIRYAGKSIEASDVFLEKTPSHAWHLQKIISDFPDARIVYIKRHPVDAITSHYLNLSKGDRAISDLIKDWKRTHDCVAEFRESHSASLYELSYENLKENRIEEMRKLLDFLSISLNEVALDGFSSKAEELILSYEKWKIGNMSDTQPSDKKKGLPWKTSAQIQQALRSRMGEQGYEIRNSVRQMAYELKNGFSDK